jgi:hypothetical protein
MEQLPKDDVGHWTDKMLSLIPKDSTLFHYIYTIQLQHQQIILLKQKVEDLERKLNG